MWEILKNITSVDSLVVTGKHIRKYKIKNFFYVFLFTRVPSSSKRRTGGST